MSRRRAVFFAVLLSRAVVGFSAPAASSNELLSSRLVSTLREEVVCLRRVLEPSSSELRQDVNREFFELGQAWWKGGEWSCAVYLLTRLHRVNEEQEFSEKLLDARSNLAYLYLDPMRGRTISDEAMFLCRHALLLVEDHLEAPDVGEMRDILRAAIARGLRGLEVSSAYGRSHADHFSGHAPSYGSEGASTGGDWVSEAKLALVYARRGDDGSALSILSGWCGKLEDRSTCDKLLSLVGDYAALLLAWEKADGGPTPFELALPASKYRQKKVKKQVLEKHEAVVGCFVLRSALARRPYVEEHSALALSFRSVFERREAVARSSRVHLLLHEVGAGKVEEAWRLNLGFKAFGALWGGVHTELVGALPRRASDLNYLRKSLVMVHVSREQGYLTIISLDDDVLVAPRALHDLIQAAPDALDGCAMLTPTISTGIPTAELFADDLLPTAVVKEIDDCYHAALMSEKQDDSEHSDYSEGRMLQELINVTTFPDRWDAAGWRQSVWPLAHGKWLEPGEIGGAGAGLHPVRWNATCTELVFNVTLKLIPDHFNNEWTSSPTRVERLDGAPYLCNSAWATTPDRLIEALFRADLLDFRHPFEEAAMSKVWLHEHKEPLCVLRDAFVLHLTYGSLDKRTYESVAHQQAAKALRREHVEAEAPPADLVLVGDDQRDGLAALPRVGFGTYELSGEECYAAVKAALASGYRHVDTAAVYGNHGAVGAALRDSDLKRAELWLTTKISFEDMGYEPTKLALKRTLAELQTPYLDLVLIHFPAPRALTGVLVWEEKQIYVVDDLMLAYEARAGSWRALEEAHAEGLVRYLGVSNYCVPHLREMARYATIRPAVNQLELHPLLKRKVERDYCQRHSIHVQAYSSMSPGGTRALVDHPVVQSVAASHKSSPHEVLLAWAWRQGLGVLPRSRDPTRVARNLQAPLLPLDARSLALLNTIDDAPIITGCGLKCQRGQFLWSPELVPAIPTVLDDDDKAPFKELPASSYLANSVGSREGLPLFVAPLKFDIQRLQRDVTASLNGWDFGLTFGGHGRPLLSASRIGEPDEFRAHFINQPLPEEGFLETCCPYIDRIVDWFSERTTVVSARLLRRQPLTAYGLHNDEDLHVRPDIFRFQIPVFSEEPLEALLVVTPFKSLVSVLAERGDEFAVDNPLLATNAYPALKKDRDGQWYGNDYDGERDKLKGHADDLCNQNITTCYTLETGKLHHFDTMYRHTLVNLGKHRRVTLVLDMVANDWMREAMPYLFDGVKEYSEKDLAHRFRSARELRRKRGGVLAKTTLAEEQGLFKVDVMFDDAGSTLASRSLGNNINHQLADAFKLWCGDLVGYPDWRYEPAEAGDCTVQVRQQGKMVYTAYTVLEPFAVDLDPSLCVDGKCYLEAHVIDQYGEEILSPSYLTVDAPASLKKHEIPSPTTIDAPALAQKPLSPSYIADNAPAPSLLTASLASKFADMRYSDSHGAGNGFIGSGIVYYALCFAQRASLAVVLGSGGGFVPALLRQAQRDSAAEKSKTILIDGATDGTDGFFYGRPDYLNNTKGWFRQAFSEVDVRVSLTDDAVAGVAAEGRQIDMLVIDADHSHEQSFLDALNYLPLLSDDGIALLHDTGGYHYGCAKTPAALRKLGYGVVNLPSKRWGAGFALVTPRPRGHDPAALLIDNLPVEDAKWGPTTVYAELDVDDPLKLTTQICDERGWENIDQGCARALLNAAVPATQSDAFAGQEAGQSCPAAAAAAAERETASSSSSESVVVTLRWLQENSPEVLDSWLTFEVPGLDEEFQVPRVNALLRLESYLNKHPIATRPLEALFLDQPEKRAAVETLLGLVDYDIQTCISLDGGPPACASPAATRRSLYHDLSPGDHRLDSWFAFKEQRYGTARRTFKVVAPVAAPAYLTSWRCEEHADYSEHCDYENLCLDTATKELVFLGAGPELRDDGWRGAPGASKPQPVPFKFDGAYRFDSKTSQKIRWLEDERPTAFIYEKSPANLYHVASRLLFLSTLHPGYANVATLTCHDSCSSAWKDEFPGVSDDAGTLHQAGTPGSWVKGLLDLALGSPRSIDDSDGLVCARRGVVVGVRETLFLGRRDAEWFRQRVRRSLGLSAVVRALPRNATIIRRPQGSRGLYDEDELVKLVRETLRDVTVRVVSPEKMSFTEQARIFAETSVLIGAQGAGLTNAVFLPEGAALIELKQRGDTTTLFSSIAARLEVHHLKVRSEPRGATREGCEAARLVTNTPGPPSSACREMIFHSNFDLRPDLTDLQRALVEALQLTGLGPDRPCDCHPDPSKRTLNGLADSLTF